METRVGRECQAEEMARVKALRVEGRCARSNAGEYRKERVKSMSVWGKGKKSERHCKVVKRDS